MLNGGQTITETRSRKKAIEISDDATFKLHKWHSSVEELERDDNLFDRHDDQSFAKQQLGAQPNETKMLGLKWNTEKDTLTPNCLMTSIQ